MRNERKYKIISLLTAILAVLLVGNCFREAPRMAAAEARQHEEYVMKGARVYAENCVQCHGPRGEGVVGMPLNREVFKQDYQSSKGRQQYDMIVQTLQQGRKGNNEHYQWVKTPSGEWLSYTTMPAWGRDFGGPLDDDYIKALALFIMNPSGEQWGFIGDNTVAPFQPIDIEPDATGKTPLPNAQVDEATNAAAQALLRNTTKTLCLTCHTIGAKGGKVGPDLTHAGSWGFDQKFLEDWIKYAGMPTPNETDKTVIPHNLRMPVYWSANRASTSPEPNLKDKIVSEGPYYMPRFVGKLTNEEIATIAKYLMGLK